MVTNIALVAHDSRKQELLDWVRYNAGSLKHCHLFCTGTTGRLVSETLTEKLGPEAPSIVCLLSGPLGGDFEIGGMIAESSFPAVLVPFLMAAILMTVCGSMTTAAMTAAGLMGGLMTVLGLDPVLTTLAIGAGSMVGWHVNNSGFWIFTSLYGFDTKQGLKYFTTTNALGGIVAFIVLVIIHAVGLV